MEIMGDFINLNNVNVVSGMRQIGLDYIGFDVVFVSGMKRTYKYRNNEKAYNDLDRLVQRIKGLVNEAV